MLKKFNCTEVSVEKMERLRDFVISQLEEKGLKCKVFDSNLAVKDAEKYVKENECNDEYIIIIERESKLFEIEEEPTEEHPWTTYNFVYDGDLKFEDYLKFRTELFKRDGNFILLSNCFSTNNYQDVYNEEFYHVRNDGTNRIGILDIVGVTSKNQHVYRNCGTIDLDSLELI